jgi:hypothetical protein
MGMVVRFLIAVAVAVFTVSRFIAVAAWTAIRHPRVLAALAAVWNWLRVRQVAKTIVVGAGKILWRIVLGVASSLGALIAIAASKGAEGAAALIGAMKGFFVMMDSFFKADEEEINEVIDKRLAEIEAANDPDGEQKRLLALDLEEAEKRKADRQRITASLLEDAKSMLANQNFMNEMEAEVAYRAPNLEWEAFYADRHGVLWDTIEKVVEESILEQDPGLAMKSEELEKRVKAEMSGVKYAFLRQEEFMDKLGKYSNDESIGKVRELLKQAANDPEAAGKLEANLRSLVGEGGSKLKELAKEKLKDAAGDR